LVFGFSIFKAYITASLRMGNLSVSLFLYYYTGYGTCTYNIGIGRGFDDHETISHSFRLGGRGETWDRHHHIGGDAAAKWPPETARVLQGQDGGT
jgi:hypothetical protein